MSDESSWRWLASTRALQEEAYHQDFSRRESRPDEFADAVVMNHSALIVELSEFMNEVGWKEWSSPRGWVNRDAAVGELVDAAHFLANLLVWLGVDDAEWERRYRAKQDVNRARQRSGYDTREGKCPRCRRAYDDSGVECFVSAGDVIDVVRWCARDQEYV